MSIGSNSSYKMRLGYILSPLLIALYPGLFLFFQNVGETNLMEVFAISVLSVSFTLLAFFCVNIFFKNYKKASLFTVFFAVFFFYTGFFIEALTSFELVGINIFRWRYVMLMEVLFLTVLFMYLYKKKPSGKLFFMPGIIIFPFCILNIYALSGALFARHECNKLINSYKSINEKFLEDHFKTPKVKSFENSPSVYFIILDRYPSREVLLESLNYDNGLFLDSLERKGFILPKKSYSNYQDTLRSIPCSLNMNYLSLPLFKGQDRIFPALSEYMIRNNNVVRYFKLMGYNYIHVPSGWGHTNLVPHTASEYVPGFFLQSVYSFLKQPIVTSLYISAYLQRTLLGPLWERFFFESRHRRIIMEQLEQLKNSAHVKQPSFIFAHLVCPHAPYLFDANGEPVSIGYKEEQYVGQITFISRQIDYVIEYILSNSKRQPVIILQSDHGLSWPCDIDVASCDGQGIWQSYGMLNAYYFPDQGGQKMIYNSISPVNNFRLIFDHYFEGNFGFLEDKSYLGPRKNGSFLDVSRYIDR